MLNTVATTFLLTSQRIRHMNASWLIRLLVLFSLVVTGVPARAAERGALSPDDAWRQFVHAMGAADPAQALAVIEGSDQQIALVRDFLVCLQAVKSFRTRFSAQYGQQEWERFSQQEEGSNLPVFHLPREIPRETYREMMHQSVLPDGSAYRVPPQFGSARIIDRNGRWYLDAASLGLSPLPYSDMSAILRAFEPQIGKTDVSAAELRQDVKQALHKVVGPEFAKP